MKKIVKILFGIALLSMTGGLIGTANSFVSDSTMAQAESELPINSFKSVANGWNPNSSDFGKGYSHYVFEFEKNWTSTGTGVHTNLRTTIGNHIRLNGVSIDAIAPSGDKEINVNYSHGGKYFALKIPSTLVVAASGETKCLVEIDEGTPFYERALPNMKISIDVSTHICTVKVYEKPKQVYFDKFQWENCLFNTTTNAGLFEAEYEPSPKLIDDNKNAIPQNGYCCLLGFDKQDSANKCLPTDNFVYDDNYEFGDKIYVNGVKIGTLTGMKVNNLMGFIYFYIYDASIPNKDTYKYLTVEFKQGITIGSLILPYLKCQFTSELGNSRGWKMIEAANSGILWNKTNKDSELFGDKKGLLVATDTILHEGTSENLVSEIGSRVTLNGTSFQSLTNSEIRVYNSKNLWFYADEMNNLTQNKNVLSFLTSTIGGMTVRTFSYYCKSGSNNFWCSKISDNPNKITLSVDNLYYDAGTDTYGSAWASNHVYEGTGNHKYCGGNYDSSEKNGYLLSFATRNLSSNDNKFINLSSDSKEYGGSLKYTNLVQEDIGHHIYSNGIPFCDIDGAEIMYHSQGNIWLYTPRLTEPLTGKNHAEITIEKDTVFFDSLLPEMHIIHEDFLDFGKLSKSNLWHICGLTGKYAYNVPADKKDPYLKLDERTNNGEGDTWLGPYDWNNHFGDGTTIIAFGTNPADPPLHPDDPPFEMTYLNKSKTPVMNNMATKDFSIGYKLKLNGVPLCEIGDVQVNYQNLENFFTFIIPERLCKPFNGYKVPTLTLDDGANFLDVSLEGFTIYFKDHKWQKESVDYITDEDIELSAKYTDIFSRSVLDFDNDEVDGLLSSNKKSLSFEFKSESSIACFSLNLFGASNDKGINLLFDYANSTLTLSDATSDASLIGSYELKVDVDEWSRFYFKLEEFGNYSNLIVAIDDIVVAREDGIILNDLSMLGKKFNLLGNGQTIEFRNSFPGYNIKKPTITYVGKDYYRYQVGDTFKEINTFFTAYDNNIDLTDKIIFETSEGMLSVDGKLNKGIFFVTAKVSNESGVVASKIITIIVTDPNEAVVTFDYSDPTVYNIGDLIKKPDYIPTKESEGNVDYEFVAWVNEAGEEWDFERDYVTGDINLIPSFKESVKHFTVTFVLAGDLSGTYTMQFTSGATINQYTFEIDGYSLTMMIDGKVYTSFTFTEAVSVTLLYKNENPTPKPEPKKGCGGSIIATSCLTALISGVGVLLAFKKRKEDK